jgi:hypothetical protein
MVMVHEWILEPSNGSVRSATPGEIANSATIHQEPQDSDQVQPPQRPPGSDPFDFRDARLLLLNQFWKPA